MDWLLLVIGFIKIMSTLEDNITRIEIYTTRKL